MSRPGGHYFLWGNLVFGRGPDDAWAAYRLDGESYPGLPLGRKVELKDRFAGFAYGVEADFQLLRIQRRFDPDAYLERALSTLDPARGHEDEFCELLEAHKRLLEDRDQWRAEVYLLVCLARPRAEGSVGERLGSLWRGIGASLGLCDARAIGERALERLRTAEAECAERVLDYLPCERARSGELAYLIRAAYATGVGEPRVDANWRPQAIRVEADPQSGAQARFEPYEHDLLRLHDSHLYVSPRSLRIESELGESHQALMVVGALPEQASFPGPDVELLFSPLQLDFPVDAVLSVDWVSNSAARRLADKRMVDADQQAKEEGHGEHGLSVATSQRAEAARELQARVGGSDRSPLLRAAITLRVGAASGSELEQRVERLRAAYGRTELHRPFGDQHRLFVDAMPAQRFSLREYQAHLLPEQLGAMVPTAVAHAGSEIGPYIGHALSGSRAPILFDLAEAAALNRPPTVLLTGTLGSGKTIALQTLLYHAFCQGSRPIVDIDPKGDHRLEALPGVAAQMETIELTEAEAQRGLLDPLRIGDEAGREDLAYGFLTQVLPQPVPAAWQTKIRAALRAVIEREAHGALADVVRALAAGDDAARAAGEALSVHLDAGLARLAFGSGESAPKPVGAAQVISLRIRGLARPDPGTARSELQDDERVSQAILRLLAAYAARLCAQDDRVHSVLALDEAWALLGDSQGRAMLERFSRTGRSRNISPLLASQIVGDAAELEPLVGSYLAFGVEREAEAEQALRLLRLDPDDPGARERLIGFRAGRCIYLDHEGRTLAIRIDPGVELLAALDTTPTQHGPPPRPREAGGATGARAGA